MKNSIFKNNKVFNFNLLLGESEEIHFHQDIELIYILDGSISLSILNETFEMNKEDIIIINPNKKHSYKANKNSLIGIFMIEFRELRDYLKRDLIIFLCNSVINNNDSYDILRSYLKKILNHYLITKEKNDYYQLSLFYKVIDYIINQYLVNSTEKDKIKNLDKDYIRINEITSYINYNYNAKISLNDLSNKLFLSNAHLSRYFKKNFGMTFVEYVNNIRLNHAVEDLIYGNKTITKIVFDNGFSNSSIFNKVFKETYGVAPSTYQKNIRKELKIKEECIFKKDQNKLINALSENLRDYNDIEESNREKEIIIEIDSKNRRAYKRNWNKMINIGSASDLLKSAVQEHLLELKKKLKFKYAKFWGIFHSDMYVGMIYQNGEYNFDNVDRVLDFFVNNGIKPYIELTPKPKIIHRKIGEPVMKEDMNYLFTNLEKCEAIIEHFISHQIERYGVDEVESWYFEMWNSNQNNIDIEYIEKIYFKVFNSISTMIKKYAPNVKIGGAGFAIDYGEKKFSELIEIWSSQDIKPDFISFHMYPYILGRENVENYGKSSYDKSYLINKIKEAKEILKEHNMDNIALHVSEWNSTISNRNYSNDSCYKGAYVMKNIIDCIDEVDLLGYSIGSDLFSEFYDTNRILWGGAGLISKDGIEKPAFYGFDFMNRLEKQLLKKGDNYIVTANSHDGYHIACHNYKHFNYYYYLKSEDDIDILDQYNIFEDNDNCKIYFKIKNVKNGVYSIKTYSMNRKNGSILDEWGNMNLTTNLSLSDIEYFKRICTPRIYEQTLKISDGVLKVECKLNPHEINMIDISYNENLEALN